MLLTKSPHNQSRFLLHDFVLKLRLQVLNIGEILSIEVQVALIDTVLLGLHLVPQVLIIGDSALLLARFDHLFTFPVLLVQFLEYLSKHSLKLRSSLVQQSDS